jgi:hypothetical protein
MSTILRNRPDLIKALVPNFAVGCRRLTPAPGFLEALLEPNVETVLDSIERFSEDGIVTADGREHKFDVIICATGTFILACNRSCNITKLFKDSTFRFSPNSSLWGAMELICGTSGHRQSRTPICPCLPPIFQIMLVGSCIFSQ